MFHFNCLTWNICKLCAYGCIDCLNLTNLGICGHSLNLFLSCRATRHVLHRSSSRGVPSCGNAPCSIRPQAVISARCKTLDSYTAVKSLGRAVNPSETHSLFHCIDIPKRTVVYRMTSLHHNPTFFGCFMVHYKPLT